MAGPAKGSRFPLLVTAGLSIAASGNILIVVFEIVSQRYRMWTLSVFSLGLFFNIWAILVQLCASYSDPGEVTYKEDLNSEEAYRSAMDLDPEEVP